MANTLQDHRARVVGPSLFWLSAAHAGLFLVSVALLGAVSEGSPPLPGEPPGPLLVFLTDNAGLLTIVGMFQVGAALLLALFAATAAHRLEHEGPEAPGSSVVLVGGIGASTLLALSGLMTVTAGATAFSLNGPAAALVHQATFVLGGAGYLGFFGLMLAGIAVPAARAGLVPRWLSAGCLAVAAVAALATLSLALEALTVTIPLARFAGLLVLVAVGFALPPRREQI